MTAFGDVSLEVTEAWVATVEIRRPPDNFFDVELIRSLAETYEVVDRRSDIRAIVLCSEGKHFCAGADFGGPDAAATADRSGPNPLYVQAIRLFEARKPVVAAVQGAAIGGGLGLACAADFRVACPEARFSANFARLGFHHGFGLSVSLPRIVGNQHAAEMLFTGRRIPGDEAFHLGLCDRLVSSAEVRRAAHGLASELAASAPLAVLAIRETMRAGFVQSFRAAVQREDLEQARLRRTQDWSEGVKANAERRPPRFTGR